MCGHGHARHKRGVEALPWPTPIKGHVVPRAGKGDKRHPTEMALTAAVAAANQDRGGTSEPFNPVDTMASDVNAHAKEEHVHEKHLRSPI